VLLGMLGAQLGPGSDEAARGNGPGDRVHTPPLGSAARIVRLLHEFDDDPDAVRRFRVRYAGRTIPWRRFWRSTGELASIVS
jgi:hypothetical protein